MSQLVAKVTRWKSPQNARFQCWEVHQLWNNGEVTVDHYVEDEEWGADEECRESSHKKDYPEGFFKVGFHLVIDSEGSAQEMPL